MKPSLIFLILALMTASSLSAQTVLSHKKRQELLSDLDAAFQKLATPRSELELASGDPFRSRLSEPEPEAVVEEAPPIPEALPAVSLVSKEDVLIAVLKQFRPTGSIIMGDRRFVLLPGGRKLSEGGLFQARIPEDPSKTSYTIQLEEVTDNTFTLNYQGERITRSYLDIYIDRQSR